MTTNRIQIDIPKNMEKLAKIAIIAITVVALVTTLDVASEIGSYLGSVSVLFSASFLFALLSAINSQSLVSKLGTGAFASTHIISDIRDRIVTKTAEDKTNNFNPVAMDFDKVA